MDNPFSCCIIGETSLAVLCGEALLQEGHTIAAVVSKAKLVRGWAQNQNIASSDSLTFLESIANFDYLFSIVNYRVIKEDLLKKPRYLPINFHDSLLPTYAGLNSTSWAILNDEKTHGISWHVMGQELDVGDILKQVAIPIAADETAFSLNLKCFEKAEEAFKELIPELAKQTYKRSPQDLTRRTYFGRYDQPEREGLIDWNATSSKIMRLARGLDFGPQPNTLTFPKLELDDQIYNIKNMSDSKISSELKPGSIKSSQTKFIQIATQTNDIIINDLHDENGNPVAIEDLMHQHFKKAK